MKTILPILMFAFLGLSTSYSQVGIGTENPQARLHVDGQQNNPASGTPTNLQQGDDFVVTNQGQVGVGTTSPTQKLDVKGTIKGSEELIIGTNWTGGGAISIKNNDASKNVATFTNSTNNWAAVLTDDRLFGVNTQNPTERLDVNGNARVRNINNLTGTGAHKQVVADAEGVLRTIDGTVVHAGGVLTDAIPNGTIISSRNGNQAARNLLTRTFTLSTKSLVTFSFSVGVTGIRSFSGGMLTDDNTKLLRASLFFQSAPQGSGFSGRIADGNIPYNSGAGGANGTFTLNGSNSLVLTPGTYTVRLEGGAFAGNANGVRGEFGTGSRDRLNIISVPVR